MNGIHDLGGMHGFGPVVAEANEPYFHAAWEKTVFGFRGAALMEGMFNLDEFRHGIERMDPTDYLRSSYYERWLASVTTLLIEKGFIADSEIATRVEALKATANGVWPPRDDPAFVERYRNRAPRSVPSLDESATATRFRPGDLVITRNVHPAGHTRLPRYVRGKRGVIDHLQGIQTFADSNAHGLGRQPQAVYSVRFRAEEVWGETAEPNQMLYIDLWESYLLPVDGTPAERPAVETSG